MLGSLIVPLFALIFVAALARSTPMKRRMSFWSYKWPNFVMLYPVGAAAALIVLVRVANYMGN